MLPYHSEESGQVVGCREECRPENGGTHEHDDPLPYQHWPTSTHWLKALHCLTGKLSRDWMVGERLAEVDQRGRWWHVPPIEKMVELKITNERKWNTL